MRFPFAPRCARPRPGFAALYHPLRLLGPATALFACGCAAVKPYERERLAAPCMQSPFDRSDLDAAYQDKLMQTRTGGGLPGDAPGGGCGCVQ
jgi:hypothetical protein